ncbi:hypothetical protein AVEN_36228-1 [Araneus ventricosus]|uniref:Uncharacterized protein n=1 Tax=Araneus ventricosus TaxID=182803 RepID=A0A4Y2SQW0_ARAVE|nr:hypothetical protein AVEN_36228-1 [Araneus ventricosus]
MAFGHLAARVAGKESRCLDWDPASYEGSGKRKPLSGLGPRGEANRAYDKTIIQDCNEGCGGLVVRFRPRGRRVSGSKPDSNEEPPCKRIRCTLNPSDPYALPSVWRGSLESGLPAQASSSPSDRGSKLRGLSLNSPRVLAKREVKITKPNQNCNDLNG